MSTSSGGLVPVPLQVSPARASCAASVAGLADAAPVGSVAGLTVEVAVEQFNSFVSGRVLASCGTAAASKKGSKQQQQQQQQGVGGQGHAKSRRAGEKKKKRNLGQVLAGSPVMKCGGEPGNYDDMDVSRRGQNCCYGAIGAADGLVEQEERSLQNGSLSGKVLISDSSSDLYSNGGGDRSYVRRDLSVEPGDDSGGGRRRPAVVVGVTGGGRVGAGKGKSHARLGLGVVDDGGARMRRSPQLDGDRHEEVGYEEMIDFGKKKKRLRAASSSKSKQQGQQAPVAVSASGITTK